MHRGVGAEPPRSKYAAPQRPALAHCQGARPPRPATLPRPRRAASRWLLLGAPPRPPLAPAARAAGRKSFRATPSRPCGQTQAARQSVAPSQGPPVAAGHPPRRARADTPTWREGGHFYFALTPLTVVLTTPRPRASLAGQSSRSRI